MVTRGSGRDYDSGTTDEDEGRIATLVGQEVGHSGTGIKHGIIHRDVKSSNILLDDSWAAKVSDFGLSKLGHAAKISESDFGLSKLGPVNEASPYGSSVNTLVKGTFGYLDPHYHATGRLTRKSDVYAFGVILLEVLSRKKAVDRSLDEEHWGLVNWAQEAMKGGRVKQIVDCDIRERILPKCLKEFARLADRCLHSNPKQRPTMAEVVACLEHVLALQEKAKHTHIFGNKVPMFLSPFSGDKSVGSKRSLELYFDTIGGENRILRRFEFETIVFATEKFSEANKFSAALNGSLYKGRLQNGQDVLVARHNSDSKHGDYKIEVSVKLEHENLLKLLGYCIEGTQVFLVYEFAVYARLDCLIDDHECTLLDWDKRNKIILGVARALVYLHQHGSFRIIHRNVTPRIILLDESLDPKLSDFRIARCVAMNEADSIKEETISGSLGYIAPEVYLDYHLSTKADVYSFGLLSLVTIIGCTIYNYYRSTYDSYDSRGCITFAEYVWTNWLEGRSLDIIDRRIHADSSSITRVIHIGLLCVQKDPADRPTMEEVVGMLTNTLSLALPKPKVLMSSCLIEKYSDDFEELSPSDSDDYDSGAVEDFISELCPR